MSQWSRTPLHKEKLRHVHRGQHGGRVSLPETHLLEVVKGSKDNVMATSDQADGSQQLQHERLGPAEAQDMRGRGHGAAEGTSERGQPLPGVLVVEAQGDLVDTGWVVHHQAEARLGEKGALMGSLIPLPSPGMPRDLVPWPTPCSC